MSEKGERKVLWGGAGGVDTMDQSVGRRCGAVSGRRCESGRVAWLGETTPPPIICLKLL